MTNEQIIDGGLARFNSILRAEEKDSPDEIELRDDRDDDADLLDTNTMADVPAIVAPPVVTPEPPQPAPIATPVPAPPVPAVTPRKFTIVWKDGEAVSWNDGTPIGWRKKPRIAKVRK